MNILEHELEDVIWNTLNSGGAYELFKRGLRLSTCLRFERQVRLSNYGIVDILGFDISTYPPIELLFVPIELKKGRITTEDVLQVCRYARGLHQFCKDLYPKRVFTVRPILIGKEVNTNNDFIWLLEQLGRALEVYTFSISLEDGLVFNRVNSGGWHQKERNWDSEKLTRIRKHFMSEMRKELEWQQNPESNA